LEARSLQRPRQFARSPWERRQNKTGTKIKCTVYKCFLIKIVNLFLSRRGSLRTIALPEWQTCSSYSKAALPKAREGREVRAER
jgi:hypothetical protein